MSEWLSREEALERLKVRPQTLYAYVSRGRIGMQPGPGRSAPQPIPRRRHRGACHAPGARTQPLGHRRKRDCLGRAVDRQRRSRPSGMAGSSIGARTPLRCPTATLEETAAVLWACAEPVGFRGAVAACASPSWPRLGLCAACLACRPGAAFAWTQRRLAVRRRRAQPIGVLAGALGAAAGPEPVHRAAGAGLVGR